MGYEIQRDLVKYFVIDQGLIVDDNEQKVNDGSYMKCLIQDIIPSVENGNKTYSFNADYAFRTLFCKDIYFKNEQEYRIVLPNIKIDVGTCFPAKIQEKIDVISLRDFFAKPYKVN